MRRMKVCQPGREVVADDLRCGFPEGLVENSVARLGVVSQVAIDLAGHQSATQDRAEGFGRQEPARLGRQVTDRGVGLLRREPALLDRGVGAVAGGVHAIEPRHAAVLVDRDESALVVRNAGQPRAVEQRRCDDAVAESHGPPGASPIARAILRTRWGPRRRGHRSPARASISATQRLGS